MATTLRIRRGALAEPCPAAEFDVELEEILDGDDVVVALLRQRDLGKTSGVTVEQEMATLFTVEAGLITRIVTYGDRSEALREASLSP